MLEERLKEICTSVYVQIRPWLLLLTCDCRVRAAVGSFKQARAETALHVAQPPAERGLTDIQRLGSLEETSMQ